MTTKQQARGLRNNNPGNIDYNPKNKWQGQVGIETGVPSPRFARFKDVTFGIRAIAVLLTTYYDRYDCNTVKKVLNRWAPPVENDTGAYARAVAADIGVTINQAINLHDYEIMRPLVTGIIEHENGLRSYKEAVTDDQVDKGLVMAGILPPKKPLAKSKTIVGSSVAAGATALPLVAEVHDVVANVKDQVEPLAWYSDSLRLVFLVLALAGIGLAIYAKIRERKKGIS